MEKWLVISAEDLSQFYEGRRLGDGKYVAYCPLCASNSETLYITDGRKGTLIYCHSGCDKEEILKEHDIQLFQLFVNQKSKPKLPYDPTDDLIAVEIIRANRNEITSESDIAWAYSVKERLIAHNHWKPKL